MSLVRLKVNKECLDLIWLSPAGLVSDKDSANFTIAAAMLYPDERLLVKVNNEVLLDTTSGVAVSLDSR